MRKERRENPRRSCHSSTLGRPSLAVQTSLEVRVVAFGEWDGDRRARAVRTFEWRRERSRWKHDFRVALVDADQAAKIAEAVAAEPHPVRTLFVELIDG